MRVREVGGTWCVCLSCPLPDQPLFNKTHRHGRRLHLERPLKGALRRVLDEACAETSKKREGRAEAMRAERASVCVCERVLRVRRACARRGRDGPPLVHSATARPPGHGLAATPGGGVGLGARSTPEQARRVLDCFRGTAEPIGPAGGHAPVDLSPLSLLLCPPRPYQTQ